MSFKKLFLIILIVLPMIAIGDNKLLMMDVIVEEKSKFLECEDYVDVEYKLLSQSKIPFWKDSQQWALRPTVMNI